MSKLNKKQLKTLATVVASLTITGSAIIIYNGGNILQGIVNFLVSITPALYTGLALGIIFAEYKNLETN